MKIEIKPKSLLHLKHICEVLYKLHPYVLDELVDMQRSLGGVLGMADLSNPSIEEREFIRNFNDSTEEKSNDSTEEKSTSASNAIGEILKNPPLFFETKDLKRFGELKRFYDLRKYLQLDTDEYIPMTINVEVEDPVFGRKVRELVKALEKTRAIEQFTFGKEEMDEIAYFAEGYRLTMNEEQKKKFDDYIGCNDPRVVEDLLHKEKLYP